MFDPKSQIEQDRRWSYAGFRDPGRREQVERIKKEGGQEREADGVVEWKEEGEEPVRLRQKEAEESGGKERSDGLIVDGQM